MPHTAFALSPADRNFVLAVARRILPADRAEDAAQDALLAAFRYFASFRGDAAFRTWLYRIALTTALGYVRAQRRSCEDAVGDDALLRRQLVEPGPGPDELAATRQLLARVRTVIPRLHATQRDVLALRLADLTEPEIAARLGISVANVKIRAHRARGQLRDVLAGSEVHVRAVERSPGAAKRCTLAADGDGADACVARAVSDTDAR